MAFLGLISARLSPLALPIIVLAFPIILAILIFFATATKRLHDLNLSGGWAFGFIAASVFAKSDSDLIAAGASLLYCVGIIWLGAARGSAGENLFGPEPISRNSERLSRRTGAWSNQNPTPFYLNKTRQEQQEWFASTPSWDRVSPSVIDAILDGVTDKVLLEGFVVASTEKELVARYELLGRENEGSAVIRAQISQILSETGLHCIGSLEKALEAKHTDGAGHVAALAANLFEPAIALAKDQIAAYIGMAHLYRLGGKRDECHDWAKRGLAALEEMRPYKSAMQQSTILPADIFDQEEKYLRTLLEY